MVAQINLDYLKIGPNRVVPRLLSYLFFEGRPVTTKGRWINPILFEMFKLYKSLPKFKKVKKPIFIIGTGRSGTTILGVILSMHKKVGFLNEPKALWSSICPYEDIIGSYSNDEAKYRLLAADVDEKMITAAHKLYGAYLSITFNNTVVDKYPELIFRIPFIKKIFPDAKFIFIVRNGWDTCYSINRWSERHNEIKQKNIQNWWGINFRKWNLLVNQIILNDNKLNKILIPFIEEKDPFNMAIIEWIATMNEGLEQIKNYPDSIKIIKFEELTQYPCQTILEIFDFCDLMKDSKVLHFAQSVLSPAISHPKLKVHPKIMELIDKTSKEFGY